MRTTHAVPQQFSEHMSLSCCFCTLSPLPAHPRWELGAEGCGVGQRWKNAISSLSLDPLWSVCLSISSSTVSRRLQLLVAAALHHRRSAAQMQHLFRWLALKAESGLAGVGQHAEVRPVPSRSLLRLSLHTAKSPFNSI